MKHEPLWLAPESIGLPEYLDNKIGVLPGRNIPGDDLSYKLEKNCDNIGASDAEVVEGVSLYAGVDKLMIRDDNNTYVGSARFLGVSSPGKEVHLGYSDTKTICSFNIFTLARLACEVIKKW